MNYINNDGLVDLIKEGDVDFIAYALTPWHAIGVSACIKKINNCSNISKGIILISTPENDSQHFLIDENNFQIDKTIKCKYYYYINYKTDVSLKTFFSEIFYSLRKESHVSEISIINPLNINYRIGSYIIDNTNIKSINYYIVDEGLKNYLPIKTKFHLDIHSIISIIKSIRSKAITHISSKTKNINYFLIMNKIHGKCIPNYDVLHYYQNSIPVVKFSLENISPYYNSIVLNSQPYEEFNKNYGGADFMVIKELCRLLELESVILKPHPREKKLDKYYELKCNVEKNSKASLEEILANIPKDLLPKCIIGFTSTTLVTSKLFWNIKTVSLINLLDKQFVGDELFISMKTFERTFNNIVYFPKSYDELLEFIKNS